MPIEVNTKSILCSRCGKAYATRKNYFHVSYAAMHKGTQTLPVCKTCSTEIFNTYLASAPTAKDAMRQFCRKFDLYWNEDVFATVEKMNATRNLLPGYLNKINTVKFAGKCYDDTLNEEGTLWAPIASVGAEVPATYSECAEEEDEQDPEIPKEWELFWGAGYKYATYEQLEELLEFNLDQWKVERDDLDLGARVLVTQLCCTQLDAAKKRAAGLFPKDEIATINNIMASLNLKPAQQKAEDDDSKISSTPLGVWAKRLEFERPIPEADPEFKDVDGIIKYITTWFFGHAAKMLGKKNLYSKLYEDAMEDYRIKRPDVEGDDEEEFFDNLFPYTREDDDDAEEEVDDE